MREILFRGKNTKDEWVEGSLVVTNNFIRNKPKQHTKYWIIQSAFGNGGWFCIQKKQYVKSDSIEQLKEYDKNGNKIWEKVI